MPDLVVIVYPTEAKAEEMRQKLLDLQKEYLIELSDAVVAVKQGTGRVTLNQLMHTTATGALSGGFWGLLIGAIFLMPLLGASIGAASGALTGALTDVGKGTGGAVVQTSLDHTKEQALRDALTPTSDTVGSLHVAKAVS